MVVHCFRTVPSMATVLCRKSFGRSMRSATSAFGIPVNAPYSLGCYFFFHSGEKVLRVDLEEITMVAPRRNGRMARVEGQIVPRGDGYQFVASAVEFE